MSSTFKSSLQKVIGSEENKGGKIYGSNFNEAIA